MSYPVETIENDNNIIKKWFKSFFLSKEG
jgi:hypothetical protein